MTNAEKHKHNPLFMDDVINTVGNTVGKMNKMLDVVSGKTKSSSTSKVDVILLLQELVKMREKADNRPIPVLKLQSESCLVKADKDQLQSIFGHLVQNAQDATADTGSIEIIQTENADKLILQFKDSGHGMDEDFIKNKLFKPFKSTKGKGMGIGVYETREIINNINGTIDVESTVGEGTCFTVTLPKSAI
jgi:putative PEP-CTERM system histidine kinase